MLNGAIAILCVTVFIAISAFSLVLQLANDQSCTCRQGEYMAEKVVSTVLMLSTCITNSQDNIADKWVLSQTKQNKSCTVRHVFPVKRQKYC